MARQRQTNRKVCLTYVGREPKDPRALLEAIEEVFRPKDVEISVGSAEAQPSPDKPNEQLETEAREASAERLDRGVAQAQQQGAEHAKAGPPKRSFKKIVEAKLAITKWWTARVAQFWWIYMTLKPIVEEIGRHLP